MNIPASCSLCDTPGVYGLTLWRREGRGTAQQMLACRDHLVVASDALLVAGRELKRGRAGEWTLEVEYFDQEWHAEIVRAGDEQGDG